MNAELIPLYYIAAMIPRLSSARLPSNLGIAEQRPSFKSLDARIMSRRDIRCPDNQSEPTGKMLPSRTSHPLCHANEKFASFLPSV